MTGHLEREKAINLQKLGLELPNKSVPLEQFDSPSSFLSDFLERKIRLYEDQALIIHSEESGFVPIGLKCRGMASYNAQVGHRFEDVKNYMEAKNKPATHCRLSPWAPEGVSPLDSLVAMEGIVNNFVAFVQRKLGFRPEYLWAIEPTKRGHCHIHILFIGMNYLMDKKKIDRWFEAQGLGNKSGVWIENLRDSKDAARKVLGYLIKYVSKPATDKCWSGLLSLTRRREWGMSSKLRERVEKWKEERPSVFTCTVKNNSNTESHWVVVGVMNSAEYHALIRSRSTTVEAVQRDLREIRGALHAWQSGKWHLAS